jgi:5-oxoprolinase (ATP-hydrolysing)
MYSGGQWHDAALVVREDMRPATWCRPGHHCREERHHRGRARLGSPTHRARPPGAGAQSASPSKPLPGTTVDPVLLEVFNNLFMNIAEQMGLQLQNTAYSVNIKERLDFSCALFDAGQSDCQCAAHAGAPGQHGREHQDRDPRNTRQHAAGRRVCAERPVPRRHAPARRDGHHAGLPGCKQHTAKPLFYVGSRGHHADIGGTTPGSMPPFSTRIEEEGVQINNVLLVDQGVLREA